MLIFRRSNFIITASGIVTLCKQLYSTPVGSGALYGHLQRVMVPDAVIIQFELLKSTLNQYTAQPFTEFQSDDTKCCNNTI